MSWREVNRERGGALLLLGLSCWAAACSSDHAGQQAQVARADGPAEVSAIPVQVTEAVRVEHPEAYPSNLFVERDVWVTPRSTGIVERVLVDRGQRVSQGQPLAFLETELERVELQIAEQALRFHEAEFARTRELHEQNIVSALDALRDEIERDLAASELTRARVMLDRGTVTAPFDGVVVDRLVVPGQRVTEDESTRLFRVVADDRPRARIHVPERHLDGVAEGQSASIVFDGPEGGGTYEARVAFVSPAVDAASHTALVIVEAERRDPALRVGAGVSVRLGGGGQTRELFRVPREALGGGRLVEGSPATLLVAASGRAAERRVDVIELRGADATVRGGLGPGDLVIVAGGARLSAGDPIEVRSRVP